MKQDLINTTILAAAFLTLFGIAEWIYHAFKVKAEYTRKLVHFGTGILTLLFPILLNNHWLVLFLCASFALILVLSIKRNLLQSINGIDRKSYGSIAYPLAVYLAYLAYDWGKINLSMYGNGYILFYLPILTLAICDPIAALTGKRWPYGKYKVGQETKTLLGSGMFFISSFILCFSLLILMNHSLASSIKTILAAIIIALVTTLTEALSKKGLDNLFIPLASIITLYSISKTVLLVIE